MFNGYPLSLHLNFEVGARKSSFMFFKIWTGHPDFKLMVQEIWNRHVEGTHMLSGDDIKVVEERVEEAQ